MNIYQEFEERKADYSKVINERCFNPDYLPTDEVEISIIIPVHGRAELNNVISESLHRAKLKYKWNVSLTFVEHSEKSEHEDLLIDWANYIWIPQQGNRFNKCLCFNMGVLYSCRAKYYLFHDSDVLVPDNFFQLLMENMKEKDAVQSFSKQRLFLCSHDLTMSILKEEYAVREISTETYGVTPARSGAVGGSIFCSKELFLNCGGFNDAFYSEYSIEDQDMWDRMNIMGRVGFCNDPEINLFHLWHEASFGRQTKQEDWLRYYAFQRLDAEGKKHLIKLMSTHFNKYYNGIAENKIH